MEQSRRCHRHGDSDPGRSRTRIRQRFFGRIHCWADCWCGDPRVTVEIAAEIQPAWPRLYTLLLGGSSLELTIRERTMEAIGAVCFGVVIGWITYRKLRRKANAGISV